MPEHLWDRGEVCRYFGGSRPINSATLYRDASLGYKPPAPEVFLPAFAADASNLTNAEQTSNLNRIRAGE